MEKELFLKLYKDGHFNFDYFNNCDVCNTELCKFYNVIMLTKKKNFNKIDALFDLVNISIQLNSLNHSSSLNEEYYNDSLKQINRLSKRNIQLKQQLAEKDKQIKQTIKIYSDDFVEKDKELKELRYIVKSKDQDKILFAVEQLEKLKEKALEERYNGWCISFKSRWEIIEDIDNQIKQLKEGN